jgi:hypothetical protein
MKQEEARGTSTSEPNLLDAIKRYFPSAAALYAVFGELQKGERDANRLTDMCFYAKYPAMEGKKLSRGDPLASE